MWTGINEMYRMFDAMDLLRSKLNRAYLDYDRPVGQGYRKITQNGFPRTNLLDSGDVFRVIAEVPGLTKEDLNVRIQGNYLELSGSRKSDAPKNFKAQRIERDVASFTRSFTLPADVDVDKIEAVLKDGLLTLVLPKAEAAKPKQITIN